jgi:hypothetical protein
MKKILLGATALTFAGIAGTASASDVSTGAFDVNIGGFATLGFGYVDTAATDAVNGQPMQIVNNAELTPTFTLVADNGLTFGYKMELEVGTQGSGGANADEYVASVRGSFGTFEIGVEDGAHDRLTGFYAANTFTNAADAGGLLFDLASTGVILPDTSGGDTGDDFKITYFTPTIAGFSAGVSYAVGGEGGNSSDETNDNGEGFEIGARYAQSFGDFSVSLGGGYTYFTDANAVDDPGYTVGGVLGYAGFELGLIYAAEDDDNASFGVSTSYETGPWQFGVIYGQVVDAPTGAVDDAYGISGEVVYALAPGVRTGLVVEYASDTVAGADDQSGFATGLFLGLTF